MADLIAAEAVTVRPTPPLAHLLLHCDPHDADAIGARIGVALAAEMLHATTADDWSALHLAPDEWLLIGDAAHATAMSDAIEAAGRQVPLSLVDISDRFLAWDIAGTRAEELLAAGCPMDLATTVFPVGRCTRTLFGKATVTLWRTDDDTFRLEVARSFAPYVAALLARAAAD